MNKKRQTIHLFLLSAIVIIGATLSAGQIFQQGIAQVDKPNPAGVAAANIPYLPPGLMQSIIDQARNTNATKFAFHNAINATTAALNKTAGMNATGASGMNANGASGTNATGASGMNANGASGMNATGASGMNATGASGMNATGASGMNATGASGMNATGASGMNATGAS